MSTLTSDMAHSLVECVHHEIGASLVYVSKCIWKVCRECQFVIYCLQNRLAAAYYSDKEPYYPILISFWFHSSLQNGWNLMGPGINMLLKCYLRGRTSSDYLIKVFIACF